MLNIKNLQASIENVKILNNINLKIKKGEVSVIMGPNGSGKSTLSHVIMGDPRFKTAGSIKFLNIDIKDKTPEERAALGLFLAFQHPREISGIQLDRFLFTAYQSIWKMRQKIKKDKTKPLSVFEFRKKLEKEMKELKMNPKFAERSLNKGFSGGEKKKSSMLELAMLEPHIAIFDETDSGLDVDALKIVGRSIKKFQKKGGSALIVTHFPRLLKYIKPDTIHVMMGGKIVKSGGIELSKELDKKGYEKIMN